MASPRIVAVFDIGKTNAKLAIVDCIQRTELAVRTTPNTVREDGPYPHYDVERIWDFVGQSMSELAADHLIQGIAVTGHGASIALLSETGLSLPFLDYEHTGPDRLATEYDAVRPSFDETFSPRLPQGLNVGAQLFWLERTFPEAFAATRSIVTGPQYWVWRLTGLARCEATSLGAHTDLWNIRDRRWSSLVENRGWAQKMADLQPLRQQHGVLRSDLASDWGLREALPVAGGIHDSNASLLPHLLDRPAPFSVISTGTWAITFSVGSPLSALDESRDMLANINVFGDPVPSARFMGGREFSILTDDQDTISTDENLGHMINRQIMVLPTLVAGAGPYPNTPVAWSGGDAGQLTAPERHAVASLYIALMSATCLELLEAAGPVIIEGPFAGNRSYLRILTTLVERPILIGENSATGTSGGAALLFSLQDDETPENPTTFTVADPLPGSLADNLRQYAAAWRHAAERRAKTTG